MNLLPSLRGRRRRPTTSHVTASSIFRKITAPDIFDKACEIALQYGQCKYGYIKNLVQSKCSGFESMQEEPVLFPSDRRACSLRGGFFCTFAVLLQRILKLGLNFGALDTILFAKSKFSFDMQKIQKFQFVRLKNLII